MNFFTLQEVSLFSIHNSTGIKLLRRLRLKFSHLNEHKFSHNFKDTVVPMCKNSHRRCSVKKGVLKNFAEFTGKHLCRRSATLLKMRTWHRCFPVNFAKLLRTFFTEHVWKTASICVTVKQKLKQHFFVLFRFCY